MKTFRNLLFAFFIFSTLIFAQDNYKPLFKIYENGLYGYIDSTGAVVVPPKYKSAGEFSAGLAPVREKGYYGYIDETGNFVLPAVYDFAESFQNKHAKIFSEGFPNYINRFGMKIIPFKCSEIFPFIDGYAIIYTPYNNGMRKAGVINENGILVVDTAFSEIADYHEGLFIFQQPYNIYGVVDINNKIVVPAGKFSSISKFHSGFAKVSFQPLENNPSVLRYQGFINTSGELVLTLDNTFYYELGEMVNTDSLFIAESFEYEQVKNAFSIGKRVAGGILNLKGEWIMTDSTNYRFTYLDEKLCTIDTNGIYRSIDKKGRPTGPRFFYYSNGSYTFLSFGPEKNPKKELKYGVIDTNFRFIIEPFFELNWYTGIKDGYFAFGKYLTDKNNNYIPIGDGTHISRIGICRADGKMIHEPAFEDVDYRGYINGLMLVRENGKPTYINKQGEKVWQQKNRKNDDLRPIDIDYQLMTWFSEGKYNFGWSPILNIPLSDFKDNIDYRENDLSVLLSTEKTSFNGNENGYSLYLINDMEDFVSAPSVDGALYMVLQAKDKYGNWKNIESFPSSSCGNSYVPTKINFKTARKYSVPKYSGEIKTKIRASLKIYDENKQIKYLYSNEINGSVNPAQFWRNLGIFRSPSLLEK